MAVFHMDIAVHNEARLAAVETKILPCRQKHANFVGRRGLASCQQDVVVWLFVDDFRMVYSWNRSNLSRPCSSEL